MTPDPVDRHTEPDGPHCAYTVDSLRRPRGKQNRPWWSRSCKRRPQPGSRYCWQHARMVGK